MHQSREWSRGARKTFQGRGTVYPGDRPHFFTRRLHDEALAAEKVRRVAVRVPIPPSPFLPPIATAKGVRHDRA
jgi:hypothetical protein